MTREQAINYLISSGFTHEQVGEVVRALTYEPTTKNNSSELEKNSKKLEKGTTKNDLEVDCVSRADALDCVNWGYSFSDIYKKINELPSVTPQAPRKGHWMPSHIPESILDECSECGFSCGAFTFNYCPNCGADMRGVEE